MSRRKNRSYKRGDYFRDSHFFIIACEGAKREKGYFEELVKHSQRVKIQIIAPEGEADGASSPKQLLQRVLIEIEKEYGTTKEDELWFVLDVDGRGYHALEEIYLECQKNHQIHWNIAISNPCFEVWLYLHLDELGEEAFAPKELKNLLHQKIEGGYRKEYFVKLVESAIERAVALDKEDGFFPKPNTTKVYLLAQKLNELG